MSTPNDDSRMEPPNRGGGGGFDFSRIVPQRSFGLKLILVCALALAMAIPAVFVWALIYSRSSEAQRAVMEVSELRGGQQTLMGPALVVPYTYQGVLEGRMQTVTSRAVLYPETGRVDATMTTEKLKRGLHDVPVYTVDAAFAGAFDPARLAAELPAGAVLDWAQARVFLSLSDLRGAKEAQLTIAGRAADLAPTGSMPTDISYDGRTYAGQQLVSAATPWMQENLTGPVQVSARLRLTGAQRAAFAAFAKDTTIQLAGDWASPQFDGGALPDTREVTASGFTATWRIPFLARGTPGAGSNLSFASVLQTAPGMTMIDVGNPYQSVERALKYAPMFIGLVFLTYFLFEATSGMRAHPAQYVLVGLAQTVFYMLLLSISEQLGFNAGFGVAATATVLALSLYAGSVFSRAAIPKALGAFSALYALIYMLMRMEDYALLAGSIASFLAIAATMWMTRKLDWYGVGRSTAPPAPPAAA